MVLARSLWEEAAVARLPRMIVKDREAAYHIISRTALDGYVLGDGEKEHLLGLIRWLSTIFFVDVHGFCIMGNHFHLLCSMESAAKFGHGEVAARVRSYYGRDDLELGEAELERWREKLSDLSRYVQEIKQRFARWYNKRKGRRGYFWGGRFKSVVLERNEALLNCLAYIDLNPVRAGLVSRPEDYRWCSLGCRMGGGRAGQFLSNHLGLEPYDGEDEQARLARYRRYVYEKAGIVGYGAATRARKKGQIPHEDKEKRCGGASGVTRVHPFRRRLRYFTDGLIIGSREFVEEVAWRAKELLRYKGRKRLKRLSDLGALYSFRNVAA